MKVLVTGSDGYIGTLLTQVLIDRGHQVTGLDTGFYRDGWLFNGVKKLPSVISQDTRLTGPTDLAGFDAVIHLADLSNDPLGQINPQVTLAINHLSAVALAKSAKQAGVSRFIHSSSCSVYGASASEIVTETSPLNPQTTYARCKVLVEKDVSQLADDNFSPVFLRNSTAYGPSPRMRFDLVLNNLAGLAYTTKKISLTSDGTPWRPLAHVLDICQAFACALEAPTPAIHNQIFNVGNTQANYQIRDIANIVADVFPDCQLTIGPSDGDTRSYKVSFDKIATQLPGFHYQYTARQGAEQLLRLFQAIGFTPDQFEFRGFTRLKQLQHLINTHQVDEKLFWIKPQNYGQF